MLLRILATSLCLSIQGATQDSKLGIPTLIEKLGSSKIQDRDEAANQLLEIGEPALEALGSASKAEDQELAIRARQLVATLRANKDRIDRFEKGSIELRRTLAQEAREVATRGTGGHPPERSSSRPDLIPFAALAVENIDKEVRTQAICMLAYMNHHACLPLLKSSLRHTDSTVRYYACMGLGWLGRMPRHRQEVILALSSARDAKEERVFDVRLNAASGLLDLGVTQDPELFIEAMRRDRANHALAASALALLKRKDAIELILVRLATAQPSLDHWCGKALESLTGQSFGTSHAKWKEWLEANRDHLPPQIR